jgi:hypothetical protein
LSRGAQPGARGEAVATLASLGATAMRPARELVLVGGWAGRRAQQALSEPAERALLASLDAALSAADAALNSSVAADALARVLASPLIDDVLDRLAARALESPDVERLVGRVIESPIVDVVVDRLLQSDALWLLVDEIAQSPSVTEAISHQGVGFANQMAGVARDRSRTADDRLERLARA